MLGQHVMAKDDALHKIKVEYLYHKLIKPDAEIESRIRQLRIIRDLDNSQYSQLKRQLPYVVCGLFSPPYRRTENFGYTENFVIDIDHIAHKEMDVNDLRSKMSADSRVVLCFLSPGMDGLKVMFRLKDRCYDAGIYSIFYKMFSIQLAKQYHLEQVVDMRTSDVARACFLSVDAQAYFNDNAEAVDMNTFLNADDTSGLFMLKKQIECQTNLPTTSTQVASTRSPDDEALAQIRSMLAIKSKSNVAKREVFVPEQLNDLMLQLAPHIEQAGVTLLAIDNIQYGKKLKMKAGIKEAEINVFYGKRGYSVVISPRRGTNDELNTLMAQLIVQFLNNGNA